MVVKIDKICIVYGVKVGNGGSGELDQALASVSTISQRDLLGQDWRFMVIFIREWGTCNTQDLVAHIDVDVACNSDATALNLRLRGNCGLQWVGSRRSG